MDTTKLTTLIHKKTLTQKERLTLLHGAVKLDYLLGDILTCLADQAEDQVDVIAVLPRNITKEEGKLLGRLEDLRDRLTEAADYLDRLDLPDASELKWKAVR